MGPPIERDDVRELFGSTWRSYEFTQPAMKDSSELLRRAADLVDELDPDSYYLTGIFWRETQDEWVLNVSMSFGRESVDGE
jgi:hypothetical protein